MQLIEITKEGIENCYQVGMVKPNEFRQIFINIVEKEFSLRMEKATVLDNLKAKFKGKNYFEYIYQELSDCKKDIVQCIIELASNQPEKLLITNEESKKLFLSYIFHSKALIVRDCSDLFKHKLAKSENILVDKDTLRAIDYLCNHSSGGKILLKELDEE